jgi:hypothetical protein
MKPTVSWNPSIREYLERQGVAPALIKVIDESPPEYHGKLVAALRRDPGMSEEELLGVLLQFVEGSEKITQKLAMTESEKNAGESWPSETRDWFFREIVRARRESWYATMFDARVRGEVSDWIARKNISKKMNSYRWDQALAQSSDWHSAMAAKGAGKYYIDSEVVLEFEDAWTVKRIISANDMAVEGNKLSGCQADYGKQVESGEVTAYSLRDQDDEPHVTIGIKNGDIIQIKGCNNAYPKKIYEPYLIKLLEALLSSDPNNVNVEITKKYSKTLPQLVVGVSAALGGNLSSIDELILEKLKKTAK